MLILFLPSISLGLDSLPRTARSSSSHRSQEVSNPHCILIPPLLPSQLLQPAPSQHLVAGAYPLPSTVEPDNTSARVWSSTLLWARRGIRGCTSSETEQQRGWKWEMSSTEVSSSSVTRRYSAVACLCQSKTRCVWIPGKDCQGDGLPMSYDCQTVYMFEYPRDR